MRTLLYPLLAALIAAHATSQTGNPFQEIRCSGKVDGTHALPPNASTESATVCAIYNIGTSVLRIGLISRDGFVANDAKLYEVDPAGVRGPLIASVSVLARSPGLFFDFISLNRNQELLLLNRRLYVEMRDTVRGVLIGGKIGPETTFDREGFVTTKSGDRLSARAFVHTATQKLSLVADLGNLDSVGGSVWTGTAANPGSMIGTLPPSDSSSINVSFDLDQLTIGSVLNGGDFTMEIDLGDDQATIAIDLVGGSGGGFGGQLAAADGGQSGTGAPGFGKFFFDPAGDGLTDYWGVVEGINVNDAELRLGFFGTTGSTIATLQSGASSNTFRGQVQLSSSELVALQNGGTHVVVNTAGGPNGDIRGQLFFAPFFATTFGEGCEGTNGEAPFLSAVGPFVGVDRPATYSITNAPPNTNVWLMIGFSDPMFPPWDLSVIGMDDCLLMIDFAAIVPGTTDSNGSALIDVNAPPVLNSLITTGQAAVLDSGANVLNAILTNGLYAPVL